jgi:hypothetical protein
MLLVGLLVFSTHVYAQKSVPVGTILPVRLDSSLSKKSKPGETIRARIMQDAPLGNGSKIPDGSEVKGHVVSVALGVDGKSSEITFEFDQLTDSHHTVHVMMDLRALASPLEVDDAELPDTGPDRGTPSTAYTTTQIGADEVVYRGGGHVMNASEIVGEPVPPNGVLVHVRPNLMEGCRGSVGDNQSPQALWLFASDACGIYGYSDVRILNSGRNVPRGQIVLKAERGNLNIRSGSGMLLRIIDLNK